MMACAKLAGLIPNGANLKAKVTNGGAYDLADSMDTCKSTGSVSLETGPTLPSSILLGCLWGVGVY